MGFFDKLKIKYSSNNGYQKIDELDDIIERDIEHNQKFEEKLDSDMESSVGSSDIFEGVSPLEVSKKVRRRKVKAKIKGDYKTVRRIKSHKIRKKKFDSTDDRIKFSIRSKGIEYMLILEKSDKVYLSFAKGNSFSDDYLECIKKEVSLLEFDKFYSKLKEITKLWKDNYKGTMDSIVWNLMISVCGNEVLINGSGAYPFNWNYLIDLVSEYELIFKHKNVVMNNGEIGGCKKIEIRGNRSKIEQYLDELESEIDEELVKSNLIVVRNGKKYSLSGCCYVKWGLQKKLLKERYNIDWESPIDKGLFN